MNLSHHAYNLIGSTETRDLLISLLEKEHDITAQGNPDFFIRNYETFTIDDSRDIKSLHSSRPVSDAKKIFVLTMNGITIEAQNSLLKLLEEPAEYAHFFLIIPSAHVLIPTVKSRLSMLDTLTGTPANGSAEKAGMLDPNLLAEAQTFLKSTPTKRLEIVKTLTDAIAKEKKTKQHAIDFLNAVESVIYENGDAKNPAVKKSPKSFEAISFARMYIHDRAPSVKMLLEYVALNV